MQKPEVVYKYLIITIFALGIAVWDLASKDMVFAFFKANNIYEYKLTSFFSLVEVRNFGVSFGMFQNAAYGIFIFPVLALFISGYLIWYIKDHHTKLYSTAVGITIGGALGNSVDRITYGSVRDFLDFHLYGYHWPAFNVADIAICLGIGLLLILDIKAQSTLKLNRS